MIEPVIGLIGCGGMGRYVVRLVMNKSNRVLEKCCHDIDMVNWLIGTRARRVASFGGLNFFTPDNEFFTPDNEHHMDRLGRDDEGRVVSLDDYWARVDA